MNLVRSKRSCSHAHAWKNRAIVHKINNSAYRVWPCPDLTELSVWRLRRRIYRQRVELLTSLALCSRAVRDLSVSAWWRGPVPISNRRQVAREDGQVN